MESNAFSSPDEGPPMDHLILGSKENRTREAENVRQEFIKSKGLSLPPEIRKPILTESPN
jgi:hypothetical protein